MADRYHQPRDQDYVRTTKDYKLIDCSFPDLDEIIGQLERGSTLSSPISDENGSIFSSHSRDTPDQIASQLDISDQTKVRGTRSESKLPNIIPGESHQMVSSSVILPAISASNTQQTDVTNNIQNFDHSHATPRMSEPNVNIDPKTITLHDIPSDVLAVKNKNEDISTSSSCNRPLPPLHLKNDNTFDKDSRKQRNNIDNRQGDSNNYRNLHYSDTKGASPYVHSRKNLETDQKKDNRRHPSTHYNGLDPRNSMTGLENMSRQNQVKECSVVFGCGVVPSHSSCLSHRSPNIGSATPSFLPKIGHTNHCDEHGVRRNDQHSGIQIHMNKETSVPQSRVVQKGDLR